MWRKPKRGIAREQLDRRRLSEADLEPAMIEAPGPGYGRWTVHDTISGETRVVSAPFANPSFKPGTTVMLGSYTGQGNRSIAVAAPPGRGGTAQFSFPQAVGAEKDLVGIVSADPETLEAGTVAYTVTLAGFGFRETPIDTFRAVRPFDSATKTFPTDTLITLGAPTWNSATEVEIPVTVSATAPAGYEIRFEVLRS